MSEEVPEKLSEKIPEGPPVAAAPLKVLVVDDDEDQRYLLGRVLHRAGFAVVPICTGAEVMAATRAERPDVILMDVQLPDQDGFTTARALKADPALAAIPIVFLSGRTDPEARDQATALGAAAYLPKSANHAEIVRTLRALTPAAKPT